MMALRPKPPSPGSPSPSNGAGGNVAEFSVSELSSQIKRMIEGSFEHVRVRGELGRVVIAASGHVYLDLKDDRASLSGVIWKGQAARLRIKPEQGLEIIATGRLTTFPGQSKYQIVIESLEPAGAGALMALFEERKKKLAAEGLFDESRKKPLPFLPRTIGVVTSPSGAVIRDILHRLRDRFPVHVLVWPSLVQGEKAPQQIIDGIEGFNRLSPNGSVPRPDVLIVARGGGSLEDLWGFNDEALARAVAASTIPLISAVGHETDTTLIDYVADKRAPTPSAAAEMAVPVRTEILSELNRKNQRLVSLAGRQFDHASMRLTAATRGLGKADRLLETPTQQLDRAEQDLKRGRAHLLQRRQNQLSALRLTPNALTREMARQAQSLESLTSRAQKSFNRLWQDKRNRLEHASALLKSYSYKNILERGFALVLDEKAQPIRKAAAAPDGADAIVRFIDGDRAIHFKSQGAPTKKKRKSPKKNVAPKQESLF